MIFPHIPFFATIHPTPLAQRPSFSSSCWNDTHVGNLMEIFHLLRHLVERSRSSYITARKNNTDSSFSFFFCNTLNVSRSQPHSISLTNAHTSHRLLPDAHTQRKKKKTTNHPPPTLRHGSVSLLVLTTKNAPWQRKKDGKSSDQGRAPRPGFGSWE